MKVYDGAAWSEIGTGIADDLNCVDCVSASEVDFNFAGSDIQGGPALDLACSGCVDQVALSADLLAALAKVTADCLPDRYRTPFVVRLRMDGPEDEPSAAQTEVRIKLTIPSKALEAGASAVSALASATTTAFEQSLAHEGLRSLLTETG
mgnify:CR=1 FL=1